MHLRKGEQRSPEHLARNPQGLVPMLTVGDESFTQSLAIIEYLDETHPGPPLLPTSPAERAWVRSIALAIACDIHPVDNLRVLLHLRDAFGAAQEARDDWFRHWIRVGFGAIETQLGARSTGRYHDTPTRPTSALSRKLNALRSRKTSPPGPASRPSTPPAARTRLAAAVPAAHQMRRRPRDLAVHLLELMGRPCVAIEERRCRDPCPGTCNPS